MLNYIKKIIPGMLFMLTVALICHLAYKYQLAELFDKEITYSQWLSITIIVNLLFPSWIGTINNGTVEVSEEINKPFNKFFKRNDRQGT